jgi:hypothetical protein
VTCEVIKMRLVMGESARSLPALSVLEDRTGVAVGRLDRLHGILPVRVNQVPDWMARKRSKRKKRLVRVAAREPELTAG